MIKSGVAKIAAMLVLALIIILGNNAGAELPTGAVARFVDLDGDGFHDLDADDNNNSIPDKFEIKNQSEAVPISSALGDVFNNPALVSNIPDLHLAHKDKFAALSFNARAIGLHRIGFNCASGFGSGSGINVGTAISGCEGGACARQ